MFKNFNHSFVYKYPLIWNTKIIPFALLAFVIHLLFFAVGYQNSIVGSVQLHNYYDQESNATTINLFAILISVLVFLIWCVLYFRNNGFKAFYPKTNQALFQEWLLIVLFCMLNFSYALSSIFGANVQIRNSLPREVAFEHCKTISKASMFLQGSYKELNWIDSTVNGKYQRFERDSFTFEGKKYALYSLMNKNMETFPFFHSAQDSLLRLQVQRWMKENNKAEIAKIFQDYFAVANLYQLKSNINPETWMNLVYNYPEFSKYENIGKTERQLQYEYENATISYKVEAPVVEAQDYEEDSISATLKEVNGQFYYYSKYYVSQDELLKYYAVIAAAWENPLIDWDYLMVVLYLGFGISMLIFSFRVTSARNWLIAFVSLGVIQIFFGIAAALFGGQMTYPIFYVILFAITVLYFTVIYVQKRGKKWSGIFLNQLLWLLPGLLPVIYTIVMRLVKQSSGYYERYDTITGRYVEDFPKIDWFEENEKMLVLVNLAIVVFVMFVLSTVIKKWRGIPDE